MVGSIMSLRSVRSRAKPGSPRFSGSRALLWHPGFAHGLDDLFAPLQENRIVALRALAVAADGELGIEGKPAPHCGPRFIVSTKLLEDGSQIKTSDWIISVDLNRPMIRGERVLVGAKKKFAERDISGPDVGVRIVRADAQGLEFVTFGFLGMTVHQLGQTNQGVRCRQIRIQ